MLATLGRFVVRRRVLVVAATLVFVALSGVLGGAVPGLLSAGGFADPVAESSRASAALERVFASGDPNLVLLVTAAGGNVDSAAVAAAGAALTARLAAEPDVEQVVSYWSSGGVPSLRSRDGGKALVLGRVIGDEDALEGRVEELSAGYTGDHQAITVGVAGSAEVFRQVTETVEADLAHAELLSLPVTLILLVLVFGSLVAATLPLAVGTIAVLGTLLALRGLVAVTDVSIFALNLTTGLGLGLAIDYSLFIVSRFREELRQGHDTPDAVVRTVSTAGRTVVFSGATVAVSLAALLVFPLMFLRSFAYAGIAVVALAVLGAVVFLPALLALLGHRVDRFRLFRRRGQRADADGLWHRVAVTVMQRPLLIAAVVVVLLLDLGVPFLGIEFGLPDDRVLPAEASARQVSQAIRTGFASNEASPLPVVAASTGSPGSRAGDIDRYAGDLSRLEGVARVDALTGTYVEGALVAPPTPASARFAAQDGTWLSVVPAVEPMSPAGEALVESLRAQAAPFEVAVGGAAAELVDAKAAVFDRVPLAAGLIAGVTFVVLFLMAGSLLVPAKAVVLNLLSLTATFGAMVWVFQDGHLAGLLDFTPTGTIDTNTPILMFCIAFGLSMDYEVFLLSRIKEEYDRTGDNTAAVAWGLERTGRIVTAAALVLAAVFIAFASSGITLIKLLGVGLTLAVLMDAFLIRATLMPAFMRLAGRANWWAPRPLRRVYDRFAISESEPDLDPTRPSVPASGGVS